MRRILATLIVAAVAFFILVTPGINGQVYSSPAKAAPLTAQCEPHFFSVTGTDGHNYFVNSDNFNGGLACVTTTGADNFKVTHQDAPPRGDGLVMAYPNILRGCNLDQPTQTCTGTSGFPVALGSVGSPKLSVHLTLSYAPGWQGDASWDLWFSKNPAAGPDNEIMLWYAHTGPIAPGSVEVSIDGFNWWFKTFMTTQGGHTWRYEQYVKDVSVNSLSNLNPAPFYTDSETRGLLDPSEIWQQAAFGFEIIAGGGPQAGQPGLSVTSFSVTP